MAEKNGVRVLRVICDERRDILPVQSVILEHTTLEDIRLADAGSAHQFTRCNAVVLEHLGWAAEEIPVTLVDIAGDDVVIEKERTADGEKTTIKGAALREVDRSRRVTIRFDVGPDAALFGLGQQERGLFNYRDSGEIYLYQNNMITPLPVLVSTNGWAMVFDHGCRMRFNFYGRFMEVTLESVDVANYILVFGDGMDDLIAGVRALSGQATLPPAWALGYWQSKERYVDQEEVLETVDRFAAEGIGLSCIVQDWQTWDEGCWGNKRVDRTRFPDLEALVTALHERNVAFMFSVWPNMNAGCSDQQEFAKAKLLLANASTYDAYSEEGRALYWTQLERELVAAGVDAWWCDSTEPFTPDWSGKQKLSDRARYELAGETFDQYIDSRQSNLYALLHAMGIYEHERRQRPEQRVVNLTRSGYIGSQRYGVILWSGDISASWSTLRQQIAVGLNVALSGVPWWTLDIGAFFVGHIQAWRRWNRSPDGEPAWFWDGDYEDGVSDPAYRELYLRWLQFGTFLPIMRSHGTDTPREPWHFGAAGDPIRDSIVRHIEMRYRLHPYLYALAGATTHHAYTPMRSLVFDFASDPVARDISDQFMLGPSILVSPVLAAMTHGRPGEVVGPSVRPLWLPGDETVFWHDLYGGTQHRGGQWIEAEVTLDRMPLYIKAGAIIPVREQTGPGQDLSVSASVKKIDGRMAGQPDLICIWPGADGAFTLYLDNGSDYSYEEGQFTEVSLNWIDGVRKLIIGTARGRAKASWSMRIHVVKPDKAYYDFWVSEVEAMGDGQSTDAFVRYSGEEMIVQL